MNELDEWNEETLRSEGVAWRGTRAACPPPDLLMARRSDALDAAARHALEEHAAACGACARLARDLDAMDLDQPDANAAERVWVRLLSGAARAGSRWLPLAAVLVMTVGAGAAWWTWSSGPAEAPKPAAVTGPPPAASPAAVALWTVEPAPVRVSISALGPSRSAEAVAAPLLEALAGYRAGRYGESIAPLESLVAGQPADAEAWFYLGVTYLLSDRPRDAVRALEEARGRAVPARLDDVDWYLATAEQRAGRVEPARTRLRALCAGASEHRPHACAAEAALR